MKKTFLLPLAAACLPLVLLAPACDEASPVAPAGTVLSISVSPSRIAADGTATVLVTALKANGTAVNPGTEIRLDTTLGTVPNLATTDSSGVAEATLTGDGRVGMATVTARAGAAEAVTVDVEIGEFAATVSLQTSPSQVAAGGSVDLLAIVRDDEGRPLGGANVNFVTQVGTLDSGGSLVFTDSQGEATDVLRVSEADIEALTQPTFTVEVTVGGEGGQGGSDMATIRAITDEPVALFIARPSSLNEVIFDNQSEGPEPLSYEWNFGDGSAPNTQESPVYDYSNEGTFQVRLTVTTEAEDQDSVSCSITVPLDDPMTCQNP